MADMAQNKGRASAAALPVTGHPLRLPNVLLGVLVVFVLVNVAQFYAIDGRTSNRYKALHLYNTADIRVIAKRESVADVEWFGIAFALAAHAPGSTVILPDSGAPARNELRQKLYGLGEVRRIEHRSYQVSGIPAGVDVKRYMVDSGKGGRRGPPFMLVMKSDTAREFILLRGPGSVDVLLDTELIPAGNRAEFGE